MNDYQVTKLRKELTRKNQLLKEQRQDREFTEKKLIEIQAERDKYHGQIIMARQTITNVDQIIQNNVKEMKIKLEEQNSQSLNQMYQLKEKNIQEQLLNERLNQEIKRKDIIISELTNKLREISRKNKDPNLFINTKEISQQATITHNQFLKQTEKYNKLCKNMENIMAQNKILRKLHGVPDNFGFDLEEIKIAEKQQLEDYKGQCRKLQVQVQELEAQRTQLRYRLRQDHTLYSNKGQRYKDLSHQQFQLLDAYARNLKQGRTQLPQIDKSQRQMQKQILSLRAKLQYLQDRRPINKIENKNISQVAENDTRKMQEYLKEMLEPIANNINKLSQFKNVSNINQQSVQKLKQQYGPQVALANPNAHNPPIPLPISHNDWTKIKEGYSYTHASKIPVNLTKYENDIGFDSIRAKYEIAALQLQNIQSLKLLKQKQKYQNILSQELAILKSKYQKCLKIQDELFKRYFQQRDEISEKLKQKAKQNNYLINERDQLQKKLETLQETCNTLLTKTDIEKKVKDFGTRLANNQAKTLTFERKNIAWKQQHQLQRIAYNKLEKRAIQTEYDLKQKYLKCHQNQKQLTFLTNKILEQNKSNVSIDVHQAVVSRLQAINEKFARSSFKQTQLRLQIARLESIERQINIKDETIESMRQDSMQLLLELQILRNRLESIDIDYQNYRLLFKKLISYVNDNNISLLSYFKKFDRDNSGNLSKQQFKNALNALGFKVSKSEMQILFSQFDLDGSNQIGYRQFTQKLRRGGAISRCREEELVFKLFKAIKHSKITIKRAFQIINTNSSNSITKSQMQTALHKIGINANNQAIDYIFKMCDSDMDGTISCTEFEKLFNDIIKQSAIQQKQMFTQQMDWKLEFILKIEECSLKYNNSLQQTFKKLDTDGSSYLSLTQLGDFLKKAGVNLEKHYLMELFDFLDRQKDGRIQFNEFLKKLQQAKAEKKRIQRIGFIKKRTQQLKKQNDGVAQNNQRNRNGEQVSLKVRIMAMQTKHTNLLKKKDRLIHSLATKQQEIVDLQRSLKEQQSSFANLQDEYFENKEQLNCLQEKLKNSLDQNEAMKVKSQIEHLTIKNKELDTELEKYKGLYEGLSDKDRAYELRLGKVESSLKKYLQMVKDFQSQSEEKQQIGNLKIQNQYSKRSEQQISKKYDNLLEQIRKIDLQNRLLSKESMQKQKQIINFHIYAKQRSELLQRNIDNLKAKSLPSITLGKIEEMTSKIRQVAVSKSKLQEQNKLLREKNYSFQIRNDYLQNEKTYIEELQNKLKRNYTDESSVTIINLTKKLSEYKMNELKAKRQGNLLKQKQQYYTRINNTNVDTITSMQEELAQWQVKFSQRQQFWRNTLNDQMKLVEEIQKQANKARQDNHRAQKFFVSDSNQNKQQFINLNDEFASRIEKPNLISNNVQANNEQDRITIQQLRTQLLEKQKEIYKYKITLQEMVPDIKYNDFSSQMGVSTNSFLMQTSLNGNQIRNNAKIINSQQTLLKQEIIRITQAAQQSIDTLQKIIDDKNQQIKRKEKIIQELKKSLLKEKQENSDELHKLYEENRSLKNQHQMASLTHIMNKSTHHNFYNEKDPIKIDELMRIIDEKDYQLKKLQTKYNSFSKNQSSGKKNRQSIDDGKVVKKLNQLNQQRQNQKKKSRQNENNLRKKIQNLQKLSKDKDIKLEKLKQTLMEIKNDVVYEKNHRTENQYENIMQQFINQTNKGSNNNQSKMEIMLQKAMQTIQKMTKQKKSFEKEIYRLREQNKMNRTKQK